MPKTHDAFAFRHFDGHRVISRPFFKNWRNDFHFKDSVTDSEILSELRPYEVDNSQVLNAKLETLDALLIWAKNYLEHLDRHADRLKRYAAAVAAKIATNEADDVGELRARYKRALALLQRYPHGVRTELTDGDNFIQIRRVDGVSDNMSVDNLYREVQSAVRAVEDEIKRRIRATFADRLKAARKREGLTQTQLATLLRLTRRRVASYESGESEPSMTTLVRCSQKLRKTVDWLLGLNP